MKSKLSSFCKTCGKELAHKYYIDNRDKRLEQTRAYRQTPEGKQSVIRSTYASQARYPDKFSARQKLQYAVNQGYIVKAECCEGCGNTTKLEGHHPDYSKPLEAMWLCHPCHRDIHGFTLKSRKVQNA